MGSALQSSSMKVVAALTVLCLLAAPAMSKNLGSINVKDFGEVFVCAPDWAAGAIQMHDNGFTMNGNSRLYFCNRAVDGWDPNAYWQTPLNNKHFAYTLVITSGAPSTTPWRGTSTPSLPPSTPATEVADTGIAVTGEAARSTLSMLTPT